MREYRFTGVNVSGEAVRGTVFAPNPRQAKKRIGSLADQHNFQTQEVAPRATFQYQVRHVGGQIVKGEQKAYGADEVRAALERVGLDVVKVEKKLLDVQLRPPSGDIVMFVRLASNMLRRRLSFDEILNLLATDTRNGALRQTIRDLSSDLKSGLDARHAFLKHQHTLGKFTSYMLGLATVSGNMAEMFEATALYLERKDKFKKSVRSAMITPVITLLAALGAFIWYVWYIVPSYARLFSRYNVDLPPLTTASLAFATWMDANGWIVILLTILSIVGFIVWARTTRGRFLLHKQMIRLPLLGDLLHKLNLEIFCRVFGVLYSGSGEGEEVMRISAESTGNTFIEHQVRTITIPLLTAAGSDLVESMQASGVFLPMTLARFRSGAETGSVKEAAEEMADFYKREVDLKLETAIETIKTATAIFISLLVALLTILSAESAFISPTSSDIMLEAQ
ncbi:MAG: type II secretion system F family protein [Bacteroidota bacterium]